MMSTSESDGASDWSDIVHDSNDSEEIDQNLYIEDNVTHDPNLPGCSHYVRRARFVTPCCNKVYTCRFCHDEVEEHTVDRKSIVEVVCILCDERQPTQVNCRKCNTSFGNYTCLKCNLFDDEDKQQFHCDQCGICRVGGAEKFFHCMKCSMCFPLKLKDNHRCVENTSQSQCPICLEPIHSSRRPCHVPKCGHLLHKHCFDQLIKFGHYACPMCQTSLMDLSQLWEYLDNEVRCTPMPLDLQRPVQILCKDCHEVGETMFHVVGLKCGSCGSYNTVRRD